MSKEHQLRKAVDWIADRDLEDKFCSIYVLNGFVHISFLRFEYMVEALKGHEVIASKFHGVMKYESEAYGFKFHVCDTTGPKEPGTYTLDESLLKSELVG